MGEQITVQKVDSVPDGARVCHYDNLAEGTKERMVELAGGEVGSGHLADEEIDGFHDCELVKYTHYYRIDRD